MASATISLHLLAITYLALYTAQIRGESRTINFTMMMPNMTVYTDWIYKDCYNGIITDINFFVDYTYAPETNCVHSDNPMIPIEYTRRVEALLEYGERARERYINCITERRCENINMSDWRELALEQYQVCTYCEELNTTRNNPATCNNYISEYNPDRIKAVINTMYLYVQHRCTVEIDSEDDVHHVRVVPVSPNKKQEYSTAKITNQLISCPTHQDVEIMHITEQATETRAKVQDTNVALVERVNQHLSQPTGTDIIYVPHSDWSINGGYYWGWDQSQRTIPFCMIIIYQCVGSISAPSKQLLDDMKSENDKPRMGGTSGFLLTDEAVHIVAACGVVVIILTATIIALCLTIRNIRKQNGANAA